MLRTVGNGWVIVDFETASARGTPCQIAAIKYVDGAERASLETFIFQPPELFDVFNVALHGITPRMVVGAPTWPSVCAALVEFAEGLPFVAHYAPYDMGVIRDACDRHGMPWPTLRYTCTVSISRMVWPGLNSYSLLLLCNALGMTIDSSRHHDALYDARLASEVLRRALEKRQAGGLDGLLAAIMLLFGEIAPGEWYGSHLRGRGTPPPAADLNADPESPFYGKVVAFTGELSMVRRAAWELVARAGGQPAAGVTKKTDMLICGYQDMYKLATGETKSGKLRHAEELHAEGSPIEILTERDFFRMLSDALLAPAV
jgi:DNA polymerase-3 subunit epsilon